MERDSSPEEKLLNLIKGKHKSAFPPEDMVKPKGEEEVLEHTDLEKKRKDAETEKRLSQTKERVERELAAGQEAEVPVKEERKPELAIEIKHSQPEIVKPEKEAQRKEFKKPSNIDEKIEESSAPPARRSKPFLNSVLLYIIGGLLLLVLTAFILFGGLLDKDTTEIQNLQNLIASISEKTEVQPDEADKQAQKPKKVDEKPLQRKDNASFTDYQDLLKKKSIFVSPVSRNKTKISEPSSLQELIKDLKLVGIVPGDEPQAIIEDKKSGQTFFLKEGEEMQNMKIEKISTGRVLLSYDGETITLSL